MSSELCSECHRESACDWSLPDHLPIRSGNELSSRFSRLCKTCFTSALYIWVCTNTPIFIVFVDPDYDYAASALVSAEAGWVSVRKFTGTTKHANCFGCKEPVEGRDDERLVEGCDDSQPFRNEYQDVYHIGCFADRFYRSDPVLMPLSECKEDEIYNWSFPHLHPPQNFEADLTHLPPQMNGLSYKCFCAELYSWLCKGNRMNVDFDIPYTLDSNGLELRMFFARKFVGFTKYAASHSCHICGKHVEGIEAERLVGAIVNEEFDKFQDTYHVECFIDAFYARTPCAPST